MDVESWNSGLSYEIKIMEIDRRKKFEKVGIGVGDFDEVEVKQSKA